jgi:hypothetical protein
MRPAVLAAVPLRRALPRFNVGRASLAFVRARITIAVAAWLLGAATATGGCLLAVSLLGDGFGVSGSSSQQLTIAAVNKALAAAKREQAPTPSAAPSRTARARLVRGHSRAARPTSTPSPTPTPTPAQSIAGAGTLLTSPAGTVFATCESVGAYLLSWSPAQGYGVARVVRGPAAMASVVFDAGTGTVTMNVSCPSGTPTSSTSSSPGHDE